jgi:hypothetical protein
MENTSVMFPSGTDKIYFPLRSVVVPTAGWVLTETETPGIGLPAESVTNPRTSLLIKAWAVRFSGTTGKCFRDAVAAAGSCA